MTRRQPAASEIRADLGHPVIDFDGHTVEFLPGFFDVLRDIGGPSAVDRLRTGGKRGVPGQHSAESWYDLRPEERRDRGIERPSWWNHPTRLVDDRATCVLPRLLHHRLEELGFDFAVVYPSAGLSFLHLPEEDLRLAACRALNELHAEVFAPYADRLAPVAVVPMHTPTEAIAELAHVVEVLGFKAILLPSHVRRPIKSLVSLLPDCAPFAFRLDTFGIDSDYDYDRVWAECLRLRVSPATHSPGRGFGFRCSPSNYSYNHIGHFAAAAEAMCKSLVIGGVPHRFPDLPIAFLEGGAGWAAALLTDLRGHWQKRRKEAVLSTLDPALLSVDRYRGLLTKWSDARYAELVDKGELGLDQFMTKERPEDIDDWGRSGIESADDVDRLFARNFWIGCEADDALNPLAFGLLPGIRLNAALGSDIGHWDVPDLRDVLEEVHELLESGLLGRDQIADFVWRNAARFYTRTNPQFFDGTVLEAEVAGLHKVS
jgi:predicted TIM-barrel fold metal-dependent hydrolase